jgi:hypothetical protein
MKRKIIGIIVLLLIIATCFFSVTANLNLQLKKDFINNEYSSSLNLLNDNKQSKVLKESCEHFAYFSSDNAFCWIYKGFLNPPYNTTCVCGQPGYSMDFFSSGTWTIDERLLVTEYSNGALCEIDLENCEVIFTGGGGVGLNGLTSDPTSGKVYGCSSYNLYEIDPETGAQELIGYFNTGTIMIEIACDAEGVMYGWDVKFSGESYLYEIDKDTGEASIVGGMGMTLCYAQDGDFCRECDILYLAANVISPVYGSYLVQCDEDTGECTILGSFAITPEGFFVIPDPGNSHPIAEFNWRPLVAEPYTPVNFNASESHDPDGYISFYEWDWDNNGVFDENYTSPSATYFWEDTGDFPVTLRVTDNYGLIGVKTRYVRVRMGLFQAPVITGLTRGKIGVTYDYNFVQCNPEADEICYFIDWGDNTTTGWTDYYVAGEKITRNHTWYEKGGYEIKAKVRDTYGRESGWGTLKVTMPKSHDLWFNSMLNRFPLLQKLIDILGGYK